MPPRSEPDRIARIRYWILILTLPAAAVAAATGYRGIAAGLASGGVLILVNLLGTQRAVRGLLEGDGIERAAAVIMWSGKLGVTALILFALLIQHWVNPLALLAGLGSLPVSLVFDIFLFPVNKGEAKIP